jgi:hypothetical protein
MKNFLLILVVLVAGGYFVNIYLEKEAAREAAREAERVETKRNAQSTKAAVAQMVSRTHAIVNWERELIPVGIGVIQKRRTLTVDLERIWLKNRPILFLGIIKDISTHDKTRYLLTIDRKILLDRYYFSDELRISIVSEKEIIDSFLEKHPNLSGGYFPKKTVAVVALINSIRTMIVPGDGGGRDEVKIGDGELVDIIHLGDVRLE